jgi:hypothetical protein
VRTKSKQLDLLGRKTGALLLKFLRLFPKPHLETIWQFGRNCHGVFSIYEGLRSVFKKAAAEPGFSGSGSE